MSEENINTVELATELTIAWLGNQNNRVSADDVPAFLRTMHNRSPIFSPADPRRLRRQKRFLLKTRSRLR